MVLLYYHISEPQNDPLGINKNLQAQRINYITQQFIDYIEDFMNSYSNQNYSSNDRWELEKDFRFISRFGSILIDWGYIAIRSSTIGILETSPLRNLLVNRLWELNYDFMKYFVYREFFDSNHWKNNYFAGGHALQNDMLNMKVVLSLYHSQELSSTRQDSLEIRFRFLHNNLMNQFIPIFKFYSDDNNNGAFNENEGNTHWGGTYNFLVRLFLVEYFDLISIATTQNLYNENPWINNLINQYFYLFKPDETTLHYGDDYKDFSNSSYEPSIISLFNRFDHPKNKWMMKEYENHNILGTSTRVEEILLRDFSRPMNPPMTIPTNFSWFSKKTGTFIYKSSFDNEGTMFSFFNAPSNINNHQHLDNNSFQIYRYGPLFIDSGAYDYYESDHYLNYYRRTIAHNTVTIFDPNEQFTYGYSNELISNDGGQSIKDILLDYNDIIANYNFENSWLNFIDNELFTYIVSDATSSYSSHKITSYIRKVLYLKNKDRVIILDHVDQPNLNDQYVVKWNAHFKNKPIIYNQNGSIATPVKINGNNILRFDNYERDFYVNNADQSLTPIEDTPSPSGNAQIKTLLPVDIEVTLVGGSGYQYYVNGVNYPPTDDTRSEGASWRMEIRQSSTQPPKKSIHILNAIEIGDNLSPAENNSELISTVNSSILLKWDENLFFFGKSFTGFPNNNHLTNISSLEDGSYKIYAYDLRPNHLYHIKKGSTTLVSKYTNINGFLQTDILNITGNDLKIIPSTIFEERFQPQHPNIKLIPNAIISGATLNIVVDKDLGDGIKHLSLYNLNGTLMIEDTFKGNSYNIPNLHLQPGVYIVKITYNAEIMESKLIVR